MAVQKFLGPMATLSRAEIVMLGAIASGLTGLGFAIGPLTSGALTESTAQTTNYDEISPERVDLVRGIEALLKTNNTLIQARPASDAGSAAIVLWHGDFLDGGVINETEVLLVTHSALMQTVQVHMMKAPADVTTDAGPAVALSALTDERGPEKWRARRGIESRVIATGVAAVTVERTSSGTGEAVLAVGLTWAAAGPDENETATIIVELPTVE